MIFKNLFGKKVRLSSIVPSLASDEVPSGDIVAIAMALHLFYDEVHDTESNVITIKRIERRYSPWSSKIYGISKQI